MKNDFDRLKREANIDQVVHSLSGYGPGDVIPSGSIIKVRCPFHQDEHPSAYYKLGWNNIYCPVCKKAVQAIDLIMAVDSLSYGQAADMLFELEGQPDWYKVEYTPTKKPKSILDYKEMNELGIRYQRTVYASVAETEAKECIRSKLNKESVYDDTYVSGYRVKKSCSVDFQKLLSVNQQKMLKIKKKKEKKILLKRRKNIFFLYGFVFN